jgi:hypothetical protein
VPGGLPDTGIVCAYWTKSVPPTPGTESVAVGRGQSPARFRQVLKKNREIAEPSGIKTS